MQLKFINNPYKYENIRQVLKCEFNMSNRLITKLKQSKSILLNDAATFLDKQLELNDKITCNINFYETSENIVPIKMDLNILYEDEYLLILNKPCNMPVHPSILHYENSLSNGVQYYFNQINLQTKIRPVNRLDKDTTGIVIFAKNEYIQENLIKQMSSKIFYKEYLAVLEGILEEKSGTINANISRKQGSIIERCIDKNGSTAISHYEVISQKNNLSLVKFVLETGKTHQIRLHSKYINHPILGDTLYGNASNLISRQALHCHKVEFIHPISKEKLQIVCDLPEDIKKI